MKPGCSYDFRAKKPTCGADPPLVVGVVEETLGDNAERGGFRLAEDWRKRIEDQIHDVSETVKDGGGASISDPLASICEHPTRDFTGDLTRDLTGEPRQAAVAPDDDVSAEYRSIFDLGPDGIPIECF